MNSCGGNSSSFFTQLYGTERRVGLQWNEMRAIVFEHLHTVCDEGVLVDARCIWGAQAHEAGMTEWQGQCGGTAVSLAWDWVRLSGGRFCAMTLVNPRTNLRVVDASGYDIDGPVAVPLFWELVHGIDWSRSVAQGMSSSTYFAAACRATH